MAATSLRIRSVDPRAEEGSIRAVLERNLPAACREGRYEWLYRGNPLGAARVWLAEEEATGAPVGTSAAHIREVRVDGKALRALNLSDFAFDSAYRSLGPALALLKATLEPIRAGEFAFSYDLPSRSMAAIYRRLKGQDLGPMARLVLPLAAAPVIRRRFGDNLATRLLGAVGDLALGARELFRTGPRDVELSAHEGEFGPEFDRLDENLAASCRVRAARGAAYLNWRFGPRAPYASTTILARRGGQPVGFAVVRTVEEGVHSIADLGAADEGVARGLIASLAARARSEEAVALRCQVLAASPVAALLIGAGLRLRDEGPGPVVVTHETAPASILAEGANWCMLEGDGDV